MLRQSLSRRLGAAAVIAVLAGSLAACGSDETDAANDESSQSAAPDGGEAGESDDPAEESSSGELTELEAQEFYPALIEAMQEAETMAFTITSVSDGSEPSDISGVMRYDGDQMEMRAGDESGEGTQIIMVDQKLYMKGAGLNMPEGKEWFALDLNDPENPMSQLSKSTDPETMFKAMEDPKEFTLVGQEDIDGEPTNHYRVVLDGAAYVKAMEMPAEFAKFMPKEFGMDMWVDAENRPRKFTQAIDQDIAGQKVSTSTEGTYYDFGTDADIEAPDADLVTDQMPGLNP